MHNLLPPESKKEVKREYLWRLSVVGFSLFSLLGGILLFSLLPSSILSHSKEKEMLGQKQLLDQSLVSLEGQNLTSSLQDTKEKLTSLKTESESQPLYGIIKKVLDYKSHGIEITGLAISPQSEKTRKISLTGVADSRESLLEFKKNLEQEKTFSFSLPVSNFAKQEKIDFSATLLVQMD